MKDKILLKIKSLSSFLIKFQTLNKIGLTERTNFIEIKSISNQNSNHFEMDFELFLERAKNLGNDSVKTLYSFSKGIGLAAGTIVFFKLMSSVEIYPVFDFNFYKYLDLNLLVKIIVLFISFVVLLITYDAIMFGAIFVMTFPPMWATILPSSFILFEFMSFAILSSSSFEIQINENIVVTIWFFIIGVYHLCISYFCSKAVDLIGENLSVIVNLKLKEIYNEYRIWIEKERFATLIAGIVSLAVFIISYIFYEDSTKKSEISTSNLLQLIMSVFFLLFVCKAYSQQHLKRKAINEIINRTTNSNS